MDSVSLVERPSRWVWPYAIAVAAVAAALGLRIVLVSALGWEGPLLLFIVAVAVAAWCGGAGPGMAAVLLSLVAALLFLTPPAPSGSLVAPVDMLRMVVFAVSGTIIVVLTDALKRSWARAEADNARLEAAEQSQRQAQEQLRHEEERLVTLINALPDCISFKDAQGRWLVANQQQLELFGLRGADYRDKSDLELAEHNPAMRAALVACHQSDENAWRQGALTHHEEEIRAADGSVRIFDVIKVPLFAPDGSRRGLVAVGRDVTARRTAERQRDELLGREQEARKDAEQANRAKNDFLATLSHEMRTPLTSILGWAEMLLRRPEATGQMRHGLEVIHRCAREQSQIVTDLLDVSRLIKGAVGLRVGPVDLAEVVRSSIDAVRLAAQVRHLDVVTQIDPDVGPVSGDRERLGQVVWNLLNNAVKFTPPGGRIDVRLTRRGSQARLSINDTGVGIRPEFLPYLFERFRQADSSTTRRFGGLGLGLAIVRQLVEMHGGTVHAESAGEGQGTTFTVELPLIERTATALRQDTGTPPGPATRGDGAPADTTADGI